MAYLANPLIPSLLYHIFSTHEDEAEKCFLHVMNALSGVDHQAVTQPHQAAKRANLLIGPK